MTGLVIASLVIAVLARVALGWFMRRRRSGRIDGPEAVAVAADQALSGFATANAVVGVDGAGALAVTRDRRVAAIRPRGRGLSVHEVTWGAIRATPAGMIVETGERGFGRLLVAGVDSLDIRRLTAQPARE